MAANRLKAREGDAEAQYALGMAHALGLVVEKDEAEAVKWYRQAADQGHAEAQFRLGTQFEDGRGVEQSHDTALEWYRKAAEQKHSLALKKLKKR